MPPLPTNPNTTTSPRSLSLESTSTSTSRQYNNYYNNNNNGEYNNKRYTNGFNKLFGGIGCDLKNGYKIHIGSLSFRTTSKELWNAFKQYGKPLFAIVISDIIDKSKNRGYGFITFRYKWEAEMAISNPPIINNKLTRVSMAHSKKLQKGPNNFNNFNVNKNYTPNNNTLTKSITNIITPSPSTSPKSIPSEIDTSSITSKELNDDTSLNNNNNNLFNNNFCKKKQSLLKWDESIINLASKSQETWQQVMNAYSISFMDLSLKYIGDTIPIDYMVTKPIDLDLLKAYYSI